MPFSVNGQIVPEETIREEFMRLGRDPQWNEIADLTDRAKRMHDAAEQSARDEVLIEQFALNDPRPIDAGTVEEEATRQISQWGCRTSVERAQFRKLVERNLRLQRIRKDMIESAVHPSTEEMECFFLANRDKFQRPQMFHASHIVKYVNHEQTEEQAGVGIDMALEALDRGMAFAEVADQFSDCKDKSGDLGVFPAGHMVEEFEEAIRDLKPGERSDVFSTPFGFHIALLHSIKPAGTANFEEVRRNIEDVMTFAREHEAYLRSLETMRSQAEIFWVPDTNETSGVESAVELEALGELVADGEFRRRASGDVFGGWLPDVNKRRLEDLIAKHEVKTVVEIGSFLGYSTAWFARRVDRVVSISTFEEGSDRVASNSSITEQLGIPRNYYAVFERNMMAEGVWKNIDVIQGPSTAVVDQVPEVDLVYIDGDPTAAGCFADVQAYLPKARKVICGNSYGIDDSGVRETVTALMPDHHSDIPFWWTEKEAVAQPALESNQTV